MVTIYIRWQVPQGWTYTVYDADSSTEHTLLPLEMESVSVALPGFADSQQNAVEAHREQISAAMQKRYPGARVEFVALKAG